MEERKNTLDAKFSALHELLSNLGSAAVAFSGGVDSTFLLYVASKVLGNRRVLALTISSPLSPQQELADAREVASWIGVKHVELDINLLAMSEFRANPPDRCYTCKKMVYTRLWECARTNYMEWLLDGENRDDEDDYRPGSRAARELGVRSPLREVGMSKEEIRLLSRDLGLPKWKKPAAACLASRIPYGEEITVEKLRMVGGAEDYLHSLGFGLVRVRLHGELARIEVAPGDFPNLLENRMKIVKYLREIGFVYVALDLLGYRRGSMNEVTS